jgi:hypothetical protein
MLWIVFSSCRCSAGCRLYEWSVVQKLDCCVFVLWWVVGCVWDYGVIEHGLPVNCCFPTRGGSVDT